VIPGVLLVDDRPSNLLALEAALEPLQARLVKASSGREALSWLLREDFALILLDVQMPDIDGFETAALIRARERTRYTPIIFVTAIHREEAQIIKGYAHGAIDYLVKPLDPAVLHSKVRLLLEQYTREQNLKAEAALRSRERDQMQVREHAALLHAEEQRERLHALFMQAPTAIAIVQGPDQVFELANPRFEVLIGKSLILGRPGRDVIPSPTWDLLDKVYRNDEPFLATESPGLFGLEGRLFNFVAQPTHDPAAKVRGVMIHVVEVTEEVLSLRKMEALTQQLQDAGRGKDEFLAMLGHELRNPLAPILTALHLMKARSNAESSSRERAVIERQARHLSRLVDDLLDVSRATMGKVDLRREQLEVSTAILRAVEVAAPAIEAKNHQLTVTAAGSGMVVAGDPVRLAQVISNLLNNAAKYTDPGGHIELDARREGAEIVIRVRDDGRGIETDRLHTIFELFVQGDHPAGQSQGGLGVGLALVRSLVQLHGGHVEARSAGPSLGSEFIVRLPALDEKHPAPASSRPARERRRPDRSRRVLVVDDNVDTAELLSAALQQEGHEVAEEHDGLGALVTAASFRPDLMLLDIGLPGMDGFEVARRFRADPQFAKVRIVALTGYGRESDRAQTAAVGIDRHLVKPVEMDTVLGAINALLEP
jgi:signal transduction histidine kinase/DNA-binding response OmpR family regulator